MEFDTTASFAAVFLQFIDMIFDVGLGQVGTG